jgi:hypothetical protein
MQRNRDGPPSVPLRGMRSAALAVSDPPPGHLKEAKTAADIRCIIIKGIENWFLTGDTNDPDSIETVAHIGWFQVLKGYIPKEWTPRQEYFIRASAKARSRTQASSGRKSLLSSSGRTATPSGNIGAQSQTHLEKPAQTSPALAPEKRHSNELT